MLFVNRHNTFDEQRKESRKLKGAGLCAALCVVAVVVFLATALPEFASKSGGGIVLDGIPLPEKPKPVPQRIVHIDLKGMPPRAEFLQQFIPQLAKWGATGVLLEWEDMLPYVGEAFQMLRSPNAYEPDQVFSIVKAAQSAGLQVIPMIPTFSHLEMLLEHKTFSYLREVPNDVRTICPTHAQSANTIIALLGQVLYYHPNIKAVHLGGNDVNVLNKCTQCRRSALSEPELFIYHVQPLISHARSQGLQVLMFDDFVREWSGEHLEKLAELKVQLVVWSYAPDLRGPGPSVLRNMLWNNYEAHFTNRVWAASAYKGADAIDGDFVNVMARVQNHLSWLKLSTVIGTELNGFFLMGPARTEHLNPITETLPAAVPALVMCLRVLSEGRYSELLRNDTLLLLNMPLTAPLGGGPHSPVYRWQIPDPKIQYNFPGSQIYRFIEQMQAVKTLQRQQLEKKTTKGAGKDVGPAIDPELGEAIASLAHDAEERVLPKVFFQDDIVELIATKLGVQIHEAVNWQKSSATRASPSWSLSWSLPRWLSHRGSALSPRHSDEPPVTFALPLSLASSGVVLSLVCSCWLCLFSSEWR